MHPTLFSNAFTFLSAPLPCPEACPSRPGNGHGSKELRQQKGPQPPKPTTSQGLHEVRFVETHTFGDEGLEDLHTFKRRKITPAQATKATGPTVAQESARFDAVSHYI